MLNAANTEQFTDAIISSCQEIIEMMMPLSLTEEMHKRPLPLSTSISDIQDDVVASIGLTGEHSGTISLYLSLQMALQMAGWLMEETYTKVDNEVCESIGEIINMIAGGLKNRLSSAEFEIFEISIPIVISGNDKQIFHGKNVDYLWVPIETDQGRFDISLVLHPKH